MSEQEDKGEEEEEEMELKINIHEKASAALDDLSILNTVLSW